jgi:hypothetical protein
MAPGATQGARASRSFWAAAGAAGGGAWDGCMGPPDPPYGTPGDYYPLTIPTFCVSLSGLMHECLV